MLIVSYSCFAETSFRTYEPLDDYIELRIEKVNESSGFSTDYEWEFTTSLGTKISLICPVKLVEHVDFAHIKFFNSAHDYVGSFKIKGENRCDKINENLRGIMHKVDPVQPILIRLRKKDKEVDLIELPSIDPYELNKKNNSRDLMS